jgi:hypothetical protein
VAAILALAAATAYGVALWQAPDWIHATTLKDRHDARVLVVSVGGAIVVGAGLLYTARNYRLSRRGQVTDRFAVALERLGSTELYVRIGGVYALEHVMRDSPYHHNDVVEVLTEFIRGRAPLSYLADPQEEPGPEWMHPPEGSVPDPLPHVPVPDVQAALSALVYRPLRPERQKIYLDGLHLRGAKLQSANLTGAFLGLVDLSGASLQFANLAGARVISADLTSADLSNTDLTGAVLWSADLRWASLEVPTWAGCITPTTPT